MNKWFGDDWGAPVCKGEHVDTPVGVPCEWCKEPIVEGDQGITIHCGYVLPEDHPFSEDHVPSRPWHIDCFMRSVVGSVGHQNKLCSCFGGTEEDPEGMTDREAATAAVRLWHSRNPGIRQAQRAAREGYDPSRTDSQEPSEGGV